MSGGYAMSVVGRGFAGREVSHAISDLRETVERVEPIWLNPDEAAI